MAIPINIKGAAARHGGGGYFTCLDTLFLTKPKQGVAISHAWPFFRIKPKMKMSLSITFFRTKPKQGHLLHMFGHFFFGQSPKGVRLFQPFCFGQSQNRGIYFIRTEPKRNTSIFNHFVRTEPKRRMSISITLFRTEPKQGHLFHMFGHFVSDRAKKEASISITLFRTKPKKMIADPNLPPLPIACWFHSWPLDPLGRSSSISSVPFLLVILMMANYIIPEPLT